MRDRLLVMLASALCAASSILTCGAEVSGSAPAAGPRGMMERDLRQRAQRCYQRWQRDYEARKTAEQIAEYQQRLRAAFLQCLGGLPSRTPLSPRITGTVQRDGFRVEKIIFESQPQHFVTAALFLPEARKHQPPYPGVLVPCGHSRNGKASTAYQQACALLALNGIAALILDPIDQGERLQLVDEQGKALLDKDGKPLATGRGHTMVGIGSILLGRNTARFEIWDCMRGVDYLQSRPEIDPQRIGCMGNSGGGTQTAYLTALDDRVVAASPSCYVTDYFERIIDAAPHGRRTADAEYHLFGQLSFGLGHADLLMMRAPTPILICAATKDNCGDIRRTWRSFRRAKRLFTRLGYAERIDLIEYDDRHHYHQALREGATRWMLRWLRGADEPITEPAIKVLSDKEIQCTPRGQVMLLPGARSVYDLNQDYENELAHARRERWAKFDRNQLLSQVRRIAGVRRLAELPEPKLLRSKAIEREDSRITELLLQTEGEISLAARMFVPKGARPREVILYVHEKGRAADAFAGGPIEKLVKEGRAVLAVDLRGIGETLDPFVAYVLGLSYVGMRAEDILICARWLAGQEAAGQPSAVSLVAVGNVGVPALHAAALEPDLFGSVRLTRSLVSWSNVIERRLSHDQLVNAVHGALLAYDLDNLAVTLDGRLTIEQPVDAWGAALPTRR